MFGSFGQPQQQPQQAAQPTQPQTSIFGAPQTATTATQSNPFGGAFGTQPTQPAAITTTNAPAAPTTSVFGGPFGQPITSAAPTIGQPQQPQQQPQQPAQPPAQPTGFGFGTFAAAAKPAAPTTSIFGGAPTTSTLGTTTAQQLSIFGPTPPTAAPAPAAPTSSIFGGSVTQPSALATSIQPASAPSVPEINKTTKFNDLPENVRQQLEALNTNIQNQIQIGEELKSRKFGEEVEQGIQLMKQVNKSVAITTNTLTSDNLFIEDLKAKSEQAIRDTVATIQIVDGFTNAQQKGSYLQSNASFPLEYFTRLTEQMRERLQRYKVTVEQIERKLASLDNEQYSPQAIAATLQAQNRTFIALANKTAELDQRLQKIKTMFTAAWRAQSGSARDPFVDGTADPYTSITDGSGFAGLEVK